MTQKERMEIAKVWQMAHKLNGHILDQYEKSGKVTWLITDRQQKIIETLAKIISASDPANEIDRG